MATGVSGAMEEHTARVNLRAGVHRTPWRESEFDDAQPGGFTFTLENLDGRYTPDNPSSSLATKVTEGMSVCWKAGSRLVAGSVRSIEPSWRDGNASWAQVVVGCDDMLGNAARRDISLGSSEAAFTLAGPILRWPLDDESTATSLREAWIGSAPFNTTLGTVYPGSIASHIPAPRVLRGDNTGSFSATAVPTSSVDYGTATLGSWGVWIERDNTGAEVAVTWRHAGLGTGVLTSNIRTFSGALTMRPGLGTRIIGPTMEVNTPYYCAVESSTVFSAGAWTITYTFYVNGVSYGSSVYDQTGFGGTVTSLSAGERQVAAVGIANTTLGGTAGNVYLSELTHTLNLMNLYPNREATPDVRLQAIAGVVPDITLDTLPTMSSTILAVNDTSGQSALDAMNDVIRTEQGHLYTVTGGTTSAPDQKVAVRTRTRTTTVSCSFNVEDEGVGGTEFIRDITNLVSAVTAEGPETSATWIDDSLTARAGSANTTETVLARDYIDLLAWAQDRLNRGANTQLRAVSLTVDAFKTPTDRSGDLLALLPGDRVQITGLPSTQLGFSTWDSWFLAAEEDHDLGQHTFTLYLAAVLPRTAIYDTDLYMGGDVLTLSSNINSSVTSISVATSQSDTKFTTAGGDLPVDIVIGAERMTVTACTSATPQVMTVTRGVGGTTAAAHTSGDPVELYSSSLYAF